MLLKLLITLVTIILQESICKIQNYDSILSKICHAESRDICLGVYIGKQWILASSRCEHIFDDTRITSGSLYRNCSAGQKQKILQKIEVDDTSNLALFQLQNVEKVPSFVKIVRHFEADRNCNAFCTDSTESCGDYIESMPVILTPCKTAAFMGETCLEVDDYIAKSLNNSPVFCHKKLKGFARAISSKLILSNISIAYPSINQIIGSDTSSKFKYSTDSHLVKICQNYAHLSNICVGVYLRNQWVLASTLCNHIYSSNTRILTGSVLRNCKSGQPNRISNIWRLGNYAKVVLIKLDKPLKGSREIAIMDVKNRQEEMIHCATYCQENLPNEVCKSKIEPKSVTLLPCSDIYSNSLNVKNRTCLRGFENGSLGTSVGGSPVFCNNKLTGFAFMTNTGRDVFEILVPLVDFVKEIDEVIHKDKLELLERKIRNIKRTEVNIKKPRKKQKERKTYRKHPSPMSHVQLQFRRAKRRTKLIVHKRSNQRMRINRKKRGNENDEEQKELEKWKESMDKSKDRREKEKGEVKEKLDEAMQTSDEDDEDDDEYVIDKDGKEMENVSEKSSSEESGSGGSGESGSGDSSSEGNGSGGSGESGSGDSSSEESGSGESGESGSGDSSSGESGSGESGESGSGDSSSEESGSGESGESGSGDSSSEESGSGESGESGSGDSSSEESGSGDSSSEESGSKGSGSKESSSSEESGSKESGSKESSSSSEEGSSDSDSRDDDKKGEPEDYKNPEEWKRRCELYWKMDISMIRDLIEFKRCQLLKLWDWKKGLFG